MNKILIAILAGLVLSGCDKVQDSPDRDKSWSNVGHYVWVKTVEIEGHSYIVSTIAHHGISTVHSESCRCRANIR